MKHDKIVDYQKNRKTILENETIATIKKMAEKGQTVNFSTVSKTTHRTPKYLYSNPRIRAEIEAHRKPVTPKSEASAQAESIIVKMEYKRLQREYEKLKSENRDSWKQKYETEHQKYLDAIHQIQELKRQLNSLYSLQAQASQ